MNLAISGGAEPFVVCVGCGENLGTLAGDSEDVRREKAVEMGAAHRAWCSATSAPAAPGRASTPATPR